MGRRNYWNSTYTYSGDSNPPAKVIANCKSVRKLKKNMYLRPTRNRDSDTVGNAREKVRHLNFVHYWLNDFRIISATDFRIAHQPLGTRGSLRSDPSPIQIKMSTP